ncbi:SNF2- related helicase [Bifidobacterium thermophilum]|nr:SNF2- related helicase [Bifidobacterium thermophilum]
MRDDVQEQRNALSPGMRVLIRDQEWIVTKVVRNMLGHQAVSCTGISPLVRDMPAVFLDDLDTITPVDPVNTMFVPDTSPNASRSHLFIESLLRSSAPTDDKIHVGDKAAMDSLPYQLVPALKALAQPRQRILIADAVGLGKTLEAGILMSELIARRKGRRILVVTAKSMMAQFQKEMWNRFTIPLVSLDSSRIQQIRSEIPANANPFSYYDKVIVSIDTLKRDIQYGAALDASYWDIIVIDEAQNVADRAIDGRRAQRAKLAKRLATRSDTLIMLSATPHDGRAKSFASLMNMLDPTTLPDPENYSKADIEHLYVRRFKQDVFSDVSGNFPDRKVTQEKCIATAAEEVAFDCLTSMHLVMDVHRRGTNAGLFKTLLEKSLFSSPVACIKTIDERLVKLSKGDENVRQADTGALEGLKTALEKISPTDFSRYQRLLQLLRSDSYAWDCDAPDDRVVIFTERIETEHYLVQHLRKDLGLSTDAIASMDGSMSDLEQQQVVEQFGTRTSPIRILVASDVASEGLNLHYLSHRLIHFDTPWSLMVFQQRNGRIDRYGQRKQPDIRFMTIDSRNEKIKGDARILEILQEKEDQARKDIGDPALLMGKFDIEAEEAVTREAIESGESAEHFSQRLSIRPTDIDSTEQPASDDSRKTVEEDVDAFDPMKFFNLEQSGNSQESNSNSADSEDNSDPDSIFRKMATGDGISESKTLMSDYSFVEQGLQCPEFKQSAGIERMNESASEQRLTVKFKKDSPLRAWLRRRVPDARILSHDTAEWSADREYCENRANSLVATLNDEQWSTTQYLWALNPITEWVGLKSTSLLYKRDEAPIIGVGNGKMQDGETIILMNGMLANKHASPVIDQWFGLRYLGTEYQESLSLDEVWRITGYRGSVIPGTIERRYINREENSPSKSQTELAEELLAGAVHQGRKILEQYQNKYQERADRNIESQLVRIQQWSVERNRVVASRNRSDTSAAEADTMRICNEYANWVEMSLDASEQQPIIRVAAAFVASE